MAKKIEISNSNAAKLYSLTRALRKYENLAERSKDPDIKNSHNSKAILKRRSLDKLLDKLAA